MPCADRRSGQAGFTLIEALMALALTGLVLSALANITAQWLPNWNRGVDRIQEIESIAIAMRRITADLSAAEYVPAGREQGRPLFDGTAFSVTFVRTAFGPNTGIGLDVVRIGETTDRGQSVTLRSRAAFGPMPAGVSPSEHIHTADPVVLLRSPLRLSFAYAGPDRIFRDSWHDQERLPTAIMLTLRDAVTERVLSVSSATPVHVTASASTKPADSASKPGADAKQGAKTEDNAGPRSAKQDGS